MRELIGLAFCLFQVISIWGQDFTSKPDPSTTRYSLSYGMGVAMPTEKFGSLDVTVSDAGFAKPTVLYRFHAQVKPKPFWLLGFQVNYASHGFNNEPFQNLIANGGAFESWEADNWNCLRFLGEAGGILHHGPIDLNGRFLFGMTRTTYPQSRSVQVIQGTAYNVWEDADPAINWTMGAGFSFQYRFSRVYLGGFLDYFYNQADYTVRTSVVGLGTINTYTYDQRVTVLSAGLQFGIHF